MNGAYGGLRLAARVQNAAAPDSEEETKPGDEPDEDEDDTNESTSKTKEKKMTATTTDQAALDAARAEGFAAANKRNSDVLASEHYAGRENLAQTLLGNDKLSAEEITTALAAAPKIEPSALLTDNEEQARAALRQGLAEQPASTAEVIDSDASAKADNYGWGEIHAEIQTNRK